VCNTARRIVELFFFVIGLLVTLLVLIRVFVVTPNPIPMTNSYGILIELEGNAYGLIWDIGQVPSMDFDWLLCPLGSPSSILQLESELV
jgi:hypothetical protein